MFIFFYCTMRVLYESWYTEPLRAARFLEYPACRKSNHATLGVSRFHSGRGHFAHFFAKFLRDLFAESHAGIGYACFRSYPIFTRAWSSNFQLKEETEMLTKIKVLVFHCQQFNFCATGVHRIMRRSLNSLDGEIKIVHLLVTELERNRNVDEIFRNPSHEQNNSRFRRREEWINSDQKMPALLTRKIIGCWK